MESDLKHKDRSARYSVTGDRRCTLLVDRIDIDVGLPEEEIHELGEAQ